jgi:hypothetical protein
MNMMVGKAGLIAAGEIRPPRLTLCFLKHSVPLLRKPEVATGQKGMHWSHLFGLPVIISLSRCKWAVMILAGCFMVIAVHFARADAIVDIPALQDATLFGGSAANNSGSGPGMFVGADGQGRPKRGLVEFEVPAYVPSDAIITGATLTLFLGMVAGTDTGGDQTPRTIRLYDVTTAWTGTTNGTSAFPGPGFGGTGDGFPANIGDTTWNDAKDNSVPWSTPGGGGDFVSTESADTVVGENMNTAYIWGSTTQMVADVQAWLDGASPNDGWLLESDAETGQTTFRAFYTREGATEQGVPQYAPDLTVSYLVPVSEPSRLWLLGLGALAVILLARGQLLAPNKTN